MYSWMAGIPMISCNGGVPGRFRDYSEGIVLSGLEFVVISLASGAQGGRAVGDDGSDYAFV